MERSKFIGGSDAAGVLGLSRWDTPLRRFTRKTGKALVKAESTYFHPDHKFLGANLDRIVEGEDAIFEAKTASAWKARDWEGDQIPQEYIIQVYHYMMVTQMKKAYLAVLIGNQDFKIKELFWDDKIINEMKTKEVAFWKGFVEPRIMPTSVTWKDTDTLEGLFPVADSEKEIKLSDDANILVENLTAYKEDVKALEHSIETSENQLKLLLGDAEAGTTSLYRIAWINSKWSGLDGKSLKEKYPAVHAEFYKSRPLRKFNYKPLKEADK